MKEHINCIIVDDEEMATKVIASHLEHVPDFKIVGLYHSAVEAFLALDTLEVDVMFLDIQMPKITGLAMLKMMKQPPLTVLTTAHRQYALEGFELEVVDYLLKPIGLKRFLQTISRLKRLLRLQEDNAAPLPELKPDENQSTEDPDHIFVKSNRAFVKIPFSSILHVEAIKNHIKIVTLEGNHISLMPISDFEEKLPAEDFLRVHRSYIINLQKVKRYDSSSITHEEGEVPIGRTYKDSVQDRLNQLLMQ
jgi:two-component system LytT family response regulator